MSVHFRRIKMEMPKPDVICPECGCKEAFFHCALSMDNEIYNWGNFVTCLECKTPYNLTKEV